MARSIAAGGTSPVDAEAQLHGGEAAGRLRRPLGDELRGQSAQVVPALPEDVGDVDAHAAGQRQAERLHRRRAGRRIAVDDDRHAVRDGVEAALALPGQRQTNRRLGHGAERTTAARRPTAAAGLGRRRGRGSVPPPEHLQMGVGEHLAAEHHGVDLARVWRMSARGLAVSTTRSAATARGNGAEPGRGEHMRARSIVTSRNACAGVRPADDTQAHELVMQRPRAPRARCAPPGRHCASARSPGRSAARRDDRYSNRDATGRAAPARCRHPARR